MLSRTSREEIMRKISANIGYPVDEGKLSMDTRRAIANLAAFQRHIYVVSEILNGEQGRVEKSVLLSLASKLHKDGKMDQHAEEIVKLQKELDKKISEISDHILKEAEARESGNPVPYRGVGLEAIQLKCPTCGAALPMPTGRFLKCSYCDSSLSIQDVSSQMRDMIQRI